MILGRFYNFLYVNLNFKGKYLQIERGIKLILSTSRYYHSAQGISMFICFFQRCRAIGGG